MIGVSISQEIHLKIRPLRKKRNFCAKKEQLQLGVLTLTSTEKLGSMDLDTTELFKLAKTVLDQITLLSVVLKSTDVSFVEDGHENK